MGRIVFNGTAYRMAGDLPAIGSRAPDVAMVNSEFQDVSLSNWLGKRKVLDIVTSIDSPECAESIVTLDRLLGEREDVAMLVISCDTPFAHRRFSKKHGLKNAVGLSSLRHQGFGRNYGVEVMEGPLEGLYGRAILVLDENDTVVYGEAIEDPARDPDYGAVGRALGLELSNLDTDGQ